MGLGKMAREDNKPTKCIREGTESHSFVSATQTMRCQDASFKKHGKPFLSSLVVCSTYATPCPLLDISTGCLQLFLAGILCSWHIHYPWSPIATWASPSWHHEYLLKDSLQGTSPETHCLASKVFLKNLGGSLHDPLAFCMPEKSSPCE